MRPFMLCICLAVLVVPLGPAFCQTFNARRMAMGGVVIGGGGPAGQTSNVAYRAVPAPSGGATELTLPLGLIPLLANPPSLDPDDSDFNLFELANLLYNPPWNLQLIAHDAPANDISIAIARDRLAVDLGEIADVFPADRSRSAGVQHGPALTLGMRGAFVSASPLVQYDNDLSLNEALRRALRDGEPFTPNTGYAMFDRARGQAAMSAEFGWAGPLVARGADARAADGTALYVGARAKLLRGLAYGDADNVVAFSTADTLFASDPVNLDYRALLRDAGPAGGRLGRGLDLGMVWLWRGAEFGIGVNDIATRIDWRVRESLAYTDSTTGEFTQQVLRDGVPITSEVPATVTVNAAVRVGGVLVAADAVRGAFRTAAHLGLETWRGPVAFRAGGGIDLNRQAQFSGGLGMRLGHFGVDLALATHSRNLSRERGLELGAGLALYH